MCHVNSSEQQKAKTDCQFVKFSLAVVWVSKTSFSVRENGTWMEKVYFDSDKLFLCQSSDKIDNRKELEGHGEEGEGGHKV